MKENYCQACGHVWVPRKSSLSARCPACGSRRVEINQPREDVLNDVPLAEAQRPVVEHRLGKSEWPLLAFALPFAFALFFWPTVLILLYRGLVTDFLAGRSLLGVVLSWVFGISFTLFIMSIISGIFWLLLLGIANLVKGLPFGRALIATGSTGAALALAIGSIFILVGAFRGTDANTTEVQAYFRQVGFIDDVTVATSQWTNLVEEHARRSRSPLSRTEAAAPVQEELVTAQKIVDTAGGALSKLRDVIPPIVCREVHLASVGILQATLTAFTEMEAAFTLALGGDPRASDRLSLANRLIADVEREKQEAIFVVQDSNCR